MSAGAAGAGRPPYRSVTRDWGTEKWETNKGNVDIPIGLNELLYVGNAPGSLLADETVLSRNARSRRNGMMPM